MGQDTPVLKARRCYGHLGGKLGERLFDRLIELEWFKPEEGKSTVYQITEKGYEELKKLGVNPE
jgi:predicted transcriptional regulator